MSPAVKNTHNIYDAIIIGGGFYGCVIAAHLAQEYRLQKILLIEYEQKLLSRASYNNQARVHNGYHYPRSFTTAYRSRINLPRFVKDWQSAIKSDFTSLYAIARHQSKITAKQFEHFCREIGAKIQPAGSALRSLFEPRLIEDVFIVEEYVFNAEQLARWAEQELKSASVKILYNAQAKTISKKTNFLNVAINDSSGNNESFSSRYVFNCTYSRLHQLDGELTHTPTKLKHEITEIALLQTPPELNDLGITVMDGPFFSLMPFPAQKMHSLSHVRYTPHTYWLDEKGLDPYKKLYDYDKTTRVDRMLRDVNRYLPSINTSQYKESLFEIKTILEKNESDDGRPILFEKHENLPGCFSILGGKIDNIYDVLDHLQTEMNQNQP